MILHTPAFLQTTLLHKVVAKRSRTSKSWLIDGIRSYVRFVHIVVRQNPTDRCMHRYSNHKCLDCSTHRLCSRWIDYDSDLFDHRTKVIADTIFLDHHDTFEGPDCVEQKATDNSQSSLIAGPMDENTEIAIVVTQTLLTWWKTFFDQEKGRSMAKVPYFLFNRYFYTECFVMIRCEHQQDQVSLGLQNIKTDFFAWGLFREEKNRRRKIDLPCIDSWIPWRQRENQAFSRHSTS